MAIIVASIVDGPTRQALKDCGLFSTGQDSQLPALRFTVISEGKGKWSEFVRIDSAKREDGGKEFSLTGHNSSGNYVRIQYMFKARSRGVLEYKTDDEAKCPSNFAHK